MCSTITNIISSESLSLVGDYPRWRKASFESFGYHFIMSSINISERWFKCPKVPYCQPSVHMKYISESVSVSPVISWCGPGPVSRPLAPVTVHGGEKYFVMGKIYFDVTIVFSSTLFTTSRWRAGWSGGRWAGRTPRTPTRRWIPLCSGCWVTASRGYTLRPARGPDPPRPHLQICQAGHPA